MTQDEIRRKTNFTAGLQFHDAIIHTMYEGVIEKAILKEREACAQIADSFARTSQYKTQRNLAEWCASSIRARGYA